MAAQMSAADRKKLKVQELRDELTLLGLDVSGTKAVLLERLEAALLSSDPAAEDEEKKEEEGIDKKTVVEDDLEDVPPEVEADLEKLDDDLVDEGTTKEIKELTEAERRKLRAEKFGTELSLEDKAKLRKERFGIKDPENEKKEVKEKPIVQSVLSEEERQKRLKRMERFGLERSGIEELKLQKDLQRKNKKMRFGKKNIDPSSDLKAKMKAREERFKPGNKPPSKIDSEFEKKKLERAKRFGL